MKLRNELASGADANKEEKLKVETEKLNQAITALEGFKQYFPLGSEFGKIPWN
jgi:hypothetical protein